MRLITNDIPQIGSALQFEIYIASTLDMSRLSGRHVRVAGMRVEPAPNSEYAPISELAVPCNARLWYTDM